MDKLAKNKEVEITTRTLTHWTTDGSTTTLEDKPGHSIIVVDWEKPSGHVRQRSKHSIAHVPTLPTPAIVPSLRARLDSILPPNRQYLGLRRRPFLFLLLAAFLGLLVLIIGLAVGLGGKKGGQNLPLPSSAEAHTGDLTYYNPGLGSCGIDSTDNDPIVAVSHLVYDAVQVGSNPNLNPLCGKKIRARRFNEATGKDRSVDLTVVDRCTGCKATDIDVSPAMFDELAPRDWGRVGVTWAWLDVVPPGV